jgi:carbonic anhydrase
LRGRESSNERRSSWPDRQPGCGTAKDTRHYFWAEPAALDEHARFNRMVELNVIGQATNLGKTHIVQRAWRNGGRPYLHGRVFDLRSEYIHPRTSMINNGEAVQTVCKLHNAMVKNPP